MSRYGFFEYSGKYDPDPKRRTTAGPSASNATEAEKSTLGDWNRMFDVYYINGVSLKDLRNGRHFQNGSELKDFIKSNLTNLVESKDDQELLARLAMVHFHQAGLPHAISFSALNLINNTQDEVNERLLFIEQPKMRVDFSATNQGILVAEQSVYERIAVVEGIKVPISEGTPKGYALGLKGEMLLTPKNIQVKNIEMDCPHKKLFKLLDKRSLLEKVTDFVKSLFKKNTSLSAEAEIAEQHNVSKITTNQSFKP